MSVYEQSSQLGAHRRDEIVVHFPVGYPPKASASLRAVVMVCAHGHNAHQPVFLSVWLSVQSEHVRQ